MKPNPKQNQPGKIRELPRTLALPPTNLPLPRVRGFNTKNKHKPPPRIFGATSKENRSWNQPSSMSSARDSLKSEPASRPPRMTSPTSTSRSKKSSATNDETRNQLDKLRKTQLAGLGKPVLRAGQAVSDGCARHLAAIFILSAEVQGKLHDHRQRESLLGLASDFLGVQQRAALTTTDIPMPIIYGEEVAELVWQFGQFRRYATVYPLGSLTTKLPKLSTSPAFGVIAQSGSVGEKSPQIAFVTFTAFKSGGLVRIPSEIDADSIVPLGQFLARYIAREMARWEDTVGYLGDGSGTYGSVSGIGKKADTLGYKVQLATTKTKPSDITLTDLRSLRGKVDGSALAS